MTDVNAPRQFLKLSSARRWLRQVDNPLLEQTRRRPGLVRVDGTVEQCVRAVTDERGLHVHGSVALVRDESYWQTEIG